MKAFRTVLLCMVTWRFVGSQQALRCNVLWGKNMCSSGQLQAGNPFDNFPSLSLPGFKFPSFPKPAPKPKDNISIVKVTRTSTGGASSTTKPRVVKIAPNKITKKPIDIAQAISSYNLVNQISERPRPVKLVTPSISSKPIQLTAPDDIPIIKASQEQSAAEKLRNYYKILSAGTYSTPSTPIKFSTPSFHPGPSIVPLPDIKVPSFNPSVTPLSAIKIPNFNPSVSPLPAIKVPSFNPSVTPLPAIKVPSFSVPTYTPSPISFSTVSISPMSLSTISPSNQHTVVINLLTTKKPKKSPDAKESATSSKGSSDKEPVDSETKVKPIKMAAPTNLFDDDDGILSLASAAPVRDNSPEASNYEYDYDAPAQQVHQQAHPQEPQESASHYDAYIEEVQAAATGGSGKKGFSRGSGLRTIAVGSANQAKTALGNQAAAAYQAAYVAKNTLAQSASQASATAQAALAGKQVIMSGLEQQVRDAKVALQGEEMQLQQAKRAAQAAAQAAQQAMHQVNVIQAALNAAQATSENANEAASQAAGELGAQTAMVGAARQRLQTLQEQLHGVRIDFEATQSAARKAQAAAQQAQANAAAAAAKAAAAGLAKVPTKEGNAYQDFKVALTQQEPNNEEYYIQSEYLHQ